MRKQDIARRLARQRGISRSEAADQVDRTVNELLHKLKTSREADLPGFGQFRLGSEGAIEFRREPPHESR